MAAEAHTDPAARSHPTIEQELVGHQGGVYDLRMDGNGDLISAGGDGLIVRWNRTADGFDDRGEALAQVGEPVFCLGATGEGRLLAGTASGALLGQQQEGAPWSRQQRHSGGTFVLTEHATGGADGVWRDRKEGSPLAEFAGRLRCALNTSSGPAWEEGSTAGTWIGTSEGSIHHVEEQWTVKAHEGAVRALVPWPGKAALASVGADGRMVLWKPHREGEPTRVLSIDAHKGAIYRLAGDEGGEWMATCSRDRSVALWNASTLDLTHRLTRPAYPAHSRSVNALCWAGPKTWATAGDDGRILIWSMSP